MTPPGRVRVGPMAKVSDYPRAMTSRRDAAAVDGLPPLASADAAPDERGRAIEARLAARHGAPTLAELRRAYATFGAEWPGDEEIRRRHEVGLEA
jgi:hypothetical protein